MVNNQEIGINSKKNISYLPERTYLNMNATVDEMLNFFEDFYEDFDRKKSLELLRKLQIEPKHKLKTMSKGTKEKGKHEISWEELLFSYFPHYNME